MTPPDDKKPPLPPVEGDIELPLTTDWKPGVSGDDGGFRRVTSRFAASDTPPSDAALPDTQPPPSDAAFDDTTTRGDAPSDSQTIQLVPRPVNPNPSLKVTHQEIKKKFCPKCGFANANYFSCDRCGLVFSRWKPELERAEYADVPEAILAEAQRLWKAVTEAGAGSPREEAVTAFDDYCKANGAESFAAVRYRIWMGSHPEDEAVRRGQLRLVSRAQLLFPQQPPKAGRQIGGGGLLLALFVALILTGILTFIFLELLR